MMVACAGTSEVAAYLVCDHQTLRRYGLGAVAPFPLPIGRHIRSGYLLKGATLSELAHKAGIDPATLDATVRDVNLHAREGKDPAFGKGTKAYNRFQGDALHAPNPCVKPIERAPYYAIKVVVGDLGTYAGLATDQHSRVLDGDRHGYPGRVAIRSHLEGKRRPHPPSWSEVYSLDTGAGYMLSPQRRTCPNPVRGTPTPSS